MAKFSFHILFLYVPKENGFLVLNRVLTLAFAQSLHLFTWDYFATGNVTYLALCFFPVISAEEVGYIALETGTEINMPFLSLINRIVLFFSI